MYICTCVINIILYVYIFMYVCTYAAESTLSGNEYIRLHRVLRFECGECVIECTNIVHTVCDNKMLSSKGNENGTTFTVVGPPPFPLFRRNRRTVLERFSDDLETIHC